MTCGEELKIKIHYDLFDNDVYKKIGIYVSTDPNTQKMLVYFPKLKEWGEFLDGEVERVSPNVVKTKNAKFVKNVRKLEYTLTCLAC